MSHGSDSSFAIGLLGIVIVAASLLHGQPLVAAVESSQQIAAGLQFELPDEIAFEPSESRGPIRSVQYTALLDSLDSSIVEPIRDVLRMVVGTMQRVGGLIDRIGAILAWAMGP